MKAENLNWKKAFSNAFNGNRSLLDSSILLAYNDIVIPTIRSKTNSLAQVMDLANEVLAKFWQRFYVLEESLPENVNGYLYIMAMNKAFQHNKLQAKLRKQKVELDDRDLERQFNSLEEENTVARLEDNEDKYIAMQRAVKRLCETCKNLIDISYFKKVKLKNSFAELGFTSANAASKKKVRCLNKLIKYAYEELNSKKNHNNTEKNANYA